MEGDDGLHRHGQRLPSCADGLDEVLCSVHLLLDIEKSLLGLTTQILLVLLVFVHGIDKRLREGEFRYFTTVEGEGDRTVVLCVHDEIRCNLLQASSYGFTHGGTRSRIQFAQFSEERFALLVVQ